MPLEVTFHIRGGGYFCYKFADEKSALVFIDNCRRARFVQQTLHTLPSVNRISSLAHD